LKRRTHHRSTLKNSSVLGGATFQTQHNPKGGPARGDSTRHETGPLTVFGAGKKTPIDYNVATRPEQLGGKSRKGSCVAKGKVQGERRQPNKLLGEKHSEKGKSGHGDGDGKKGKSVPQPINHVLGEKEGGRLKEGVFYQAYL